MASWPWASRPRSSPPSRCRGNTHRRSKFCATAAGECSWLDSKRRSATRMGDLFHYEFMVHAFEAGTIIAIVAGTIGYFVVLRGTAFAAHALSHIGFAGATGAVVLSLNPIIGLLAFTLGAGLITLAAIIALYRPLLFSSVDEDLAAAKGVPVTALSIAFMAILAVAVTEAVQVVGVLLIFALIVTPAAIAVRFTCRPGVAIAIGIALALAFTWLGLTIAFYSPHPVSFFITSLAFGTYVVVRLAVPLRARIQRIAISPTT